MQRIRTAENFFLIFLFFFLFLVMGCEKSFKDEENYLYYEDLPALEEDHREYPLSLLQLEKAIDVILVIDNSGSMNDIQQNVIKNARLFFEKFAKNSFIDWKLGLLSTDISAAPYLGFEKSFDSSLVTENDPNSFDRVVRTFQEAVGKLGIAGSATEVTFIQVKEKLDRYDGNAFPRFQRDNAHLVVVVITDEREQSMDLSPYNGAPVNYNPALYDAPVFFNHLSQYINSRKILRFYGAIQNKDFPDCTTDGDFDTAPWIGTQYDRIIKISGGFYISACNPHFGTELARIGQDIASLVGRPSLLLKRRPKVETLQVYYKGLLLPPGKEEEGGRWYYDELTNTLNFYGLDFVDNIEKDVFTIDFEVDDGFIREYE